MPTAEQNQNQQTRNLFDFVLGGLTLVGGVVCLYLFLLQSPAASETGRSGTPLASLEYASGQPTTKPHGQWSWNPIANGTNFFEGDAIRTDEKSRIIIKLEDSSLRIEPGSYLVLRKQEGKILLDLRLGEIAPESQVSDRIMIVASKKNGARVAQATEGFSDEAMKLRSRLTLIEPSSDLKLFSNGSRPTGVPLLWNSIDGQAVLEISESNAFQNLLSSRKLDRRSSYLTLPAVNSSSLFLRLRHPQTGETSHVRRVDLVHLVAPELISPEDKLVLPLEPNREIEFKWTETPNVTHEIEYSVNGDAAKVAASDRPSIKIDSATMGLMIHEPARISWRVRTRYENSQFSEWSELRITQIEWPSHPVQIRVSALNSPMSFNETQYRWTCAQPIAIKWSEPLMGERMQLEWSQDSDFKETWTKSVKGQSTNICLEEHGPWFLRLHGLNQEGKRLRTSQSLTVTSILPAPQLTDEPAKSTDSDGQFALTFKDKFGNWKYELEIDEGNGKKNTQIVDPAQPLVKLASPERKIVRTRVISSARQPLSPWSAPQTLTVVPKADVPTESPLAGPVKTEQAKPIYLTGIEDKASARLSWKALRKAVSYQIEISSSADFKGSVETIVTKNLSHIATWKSELPRYWRIRATLSNQTQTAWSEPQSLTVNRLPSTQRPNPTRLPKSAPRDP